MLVGLVVLLLAVLGLSLISATTDESSQPGRSDVTAATVAGAAEATGTDPESGLPWIAADDLPPEARGTLALIESDGPFPYDRDGAVFQNREEILPDESRGYYHEYTVETPGSDDRGARRIVAGSEGELYYTDDHYESFRRISG